MDKEECIAELIETKDRLEVMIGTGIVPDPEDGGTRYLSPFVNPGLCVNYNNPRCSMLCPCEYAYSELELGITIKNGKPVHIKA